MTWNDYQIMATAIKQSGYEGEDETWHEVRRSMITYKLREQITFFPDGIRALKEAWKIFKDQNKDAVGVRKT